MLISTDWYIYISSIYIFLSFWNTLNYILITTSLIVVDPVAYSSVSHVSLTPTFLNQDLFWCDPWSIFSATFTDYSSALSEPRIEHHSISKILVKETCSLLCIESDEMYWWSFQNNANRKLHILLPKKKTSGTFRNVFKTEANVEFLNKRLFVPKLKAPHLLYPIVILLIRKL